MRKIIIVLFIIIIFTSGCSNNENVITRDFHLKGENTHWSVEYQGHSKGEFYKEKGILRYKEDSNGKITLTYKGELSELSSVREVGYSFVNGGGEITSEEAPQKKVFTWNHSLSAVTKEDECKSIDIIIDGNMEVITLKSVK